MSTMFLVVRRAVGADGTGCSNQSSPDTGSRVPVRLLASRAAAEELVARLTAEARRTMNPFHLNDAEISGTVLKQLKQFRFELDCPEDPWPEEWRDWWDLCADLITDEQRAAAWALFSTLPPFEVIEVEME